MSKAIDAIRKKMEYVIDRVGAGSLNMRELKALTEHLASIKHDSIWGLAIQQHFAKPELERNDLALIEHLADQAMDDIFTMTCILGLQAVILILRTVND